jgi:hypothetical protein
MDGVFRAISCAWVIAIHCTAKNQERSLPSNPKVTKISLATASALVQSKHELDAFSREEAIPIQKFFFYLGNQRETATSPDPDPKLARYSSARYPSSGGVEGRLSAQTIPPFGPNRLQALLRTPPYVHTRRQWGGADGISQVSLDSELTLIRYTVRKRGVFGIDSTYYTSI